MSAFLALLLACLPGAVSFVTGARLQRLADDAALSERLAWRRRFVAQASILAVVLTFVLAAEQAAWALPLMLLLILALGFPTRRALFGETLGLVAYLAEVVRWILAGFGFWIALALAPVLASNGAWAPVAVALALAAWAAGPGEIFTRLVGASPLARPDLESGFAGVISRSRIPPPRVMVAGHPGSRWANAFALPSLTRPTVVFTRTLVQAFPADEVVAVFAHEIAHLEHHHRRRTRVGFVLLLLLIAAAVFGLPRLAATLVWGEYLSLAWPLVLLVALVVRVARHQGHEADSDRRALELLGDPASLQSALIRLHAMGRLPRRLDPEMERSASHPSLARRLQAIQAQTGLPIDAGAGGVVLETARPGAVVILDADRAHWLEGVPKDAPRDAALRDKAARVRSLAYAELAALHVHVAWNGQAALKATDASGRRWSEPLRPADVAPAQAALDGVDARLGAPRRSPWLHPAPAALICCALILAAVLSGRVGVFLLPPLGGLLAPAPPLLIASGIGTTLELWFGAPIGALRFAGAEVARWSLPALALAALGLGAWRARRDASWNLPASVVAVLLGLIAAAWSVGLVLAALSEPRLARVHIVAAERPGAGIALMALASMALAGRRFAWAAALAGLAALPLLASSQTAARLSGDPLLRSGPTLRTTERVLPEAARVELKAPANDVRLSPDATAWAVREYEPAQEEAAPRFRVGRFAGGSRSVEASDLAFLSDGRLLRVRDQGRVSALEATGFDDDVSAWRVELPLLAGAAIELAGDGLDWHVTGWSFDERRLVVASGRVGAPTFRSRTARSADANGSVTQQVAGVRETLTLRWRTRVGPLAALAVLSGLPLTDVELSWSGDVERRIATTPGQVRCVARRASADLVCAVSHAGRTHFFRLAEGGFELTPLGTLEARTRREQLGADGRLYVWEEGGSFVELDFRAREAHWLRFGGGERYVQALALAPRYVAALGRDGERDVLSLHRLP